MPELPEVETIRRELEQELVGRTITTVSVRVPKLVRGSLKHFRETVVGSRIVSVGRRAKLLLVGLSRGETMIVHLKLTGQFIFRNKRRLVVGGHPQEGGTVGLPNKFTHITFTLSGRHQASHAGRAGGATLFFNDLRKFGFFKLVQTNSLSSFLKEQGYGPEPLDSSFTVTSLQTLLKRKRSGRIKQVLMDQSFVAGVGNIYSDEALFRAKLLPTRDVRALRPIEVRRLHRSLRQVLQASLKLRGTSADQYLDAYGQQGGFVSHLAVYGREGEPCRVCRRPVVRKKMGGRSAHFCLHCQR